MLKQEHIETHFLINRDWKEYFLKNFPEYKVETWTSDAWSLFERNGYRYEMERYSRFPDSPLYTAIKEITLYKGDKEICWINDRTESSALEQLILNAVCNFEVDFTKFK